VLAAAWPLIRSDLGLDYAEIGLLLAVPGIVAAVVEPLIGLGGDSGRRRALILGGGAAVTAAVLATALAPGYAVLMAAFVVNWPASGAFVSLSQATLMDLDADRRERGMALWTAAGSIGVVAGPLLLVAALALGLGWRETMVAVAAGAAVTTAWVARLPIAEHRDGGSIASVARDAVRAVRSREVVRWRLLLEAADLMLDVLHGFLALYFVDVAGLSAAEAGLALGVWTGAGLAGDVLLVPLLARVRGIRYLRVSAAAALLVYPAFLLTGRTEAKLALLALLGLLNAGWYAIPKAGLYDALPGRSGTVMAVSSVSGVAGALIPLALGLAAEQFGLATTMWLLLAAPVALIAALPRSRRLRGGARVAAAAPADVGDGLAEPEEREEHEPQ
jgi:MFS transporter, FSR family, fosmidomycin resistance protein